MQYFGHIVIFSCSSVAETKKSVGDAAQGWSKQMQSSSFQCVLFKILIIEKNISK